ncbi:MAG TPA: uracil-DNA glycosylase [Catalimonadaceae bacterium]|nr:uracil-DNA glycosylase [Catalimonadaceae bacterium]
MAEVKIESGWRQVLQPQFDHTYFEGLSSFVREEYRTKTIYPQAKFVFQAFDACPWDRLNVVILGQDPYINPGQAHGLSFSVPDGIPKPPSLQNIFKEIRSEFGQEVPVSGNLLRWAEQGVLLLNSVLTVQAGLSNSHAGKGWEQFTDAVIRTISEQKDGIVFMLWGNSARSKSAFIDEKKHCVLASAHPSPMSVTRGFYGNRHFLLANEYLLANGKTPINW